MAQGNSSANTSNICPAHPSDKPPSNRRWSNMAKRYQLSNGQDNNSSTASDSGTSTDWDGHWGTQECSACRGEGHNTRNCRAKRNNELSPPFHHQTLTYHPHPSPCTGDDHPYHRHISPPDPHP